MDLEWNSDGTRLLLSSEQGEMAMLDAGSGEVVLAGERSRSESTLTDDVGFGAYVAYKNDGRKLLYLLPHAALTQVACSQLSRNLTRAEWARYMGADTPYRATCPGLSQ